MKSRLTTPLLGSQDMASGHLYTNGDQISLSRILSQDLWIFYQCNAFDDLCIAYESSCGILVLANTRDLTLI